MTAAVHPRRPAGRGAGKAGPFVFASFGARGWDDDGIARRRGRRPAPPGGDGRLSNKAMSSTYIGFYVRPLPERRHLLRATTSDVVSKPQVVAHSKWPHLDIFARRHAASPLPDPAPAPRYDYDLTYIRPGLCHRY